MAHKLLTDISAVGVGRAWKINRSVDQHTVYAEFESLAATKITAVTIKLQGSLTGTDEGTGVISDPAIAIGSTAERVANGAFDFQISNTSYSKGAVAAGSVFTAAHVISASSWGAINIYINSSGTIVTKVPSATQSYASAAAAHTAADAVSLTSDLAYIGRVLINSDGTTWTANADDLTDGSDLTTATFISATSTFLDLATHTFSADEITAQKAMFHVADKNVEYIRAYLSTLTGTGEVNAWYSNGQIGRS
jgi:hypothetical protein